MKLFTSYFYAVRHMKPWQIPISTALFDPHWFHAFGRQDRIFVDKNGVLNGLRAESLHPGSSCEGLCSGRPCPYKPESCRFMAEYRKQVFALDMDMMLASLDKLTAHAKAKLGFEKEPEAILLVHEAPDNACSERAVLQEFFRCGEFDWRAAVKFTV